VTLRTLLWNRASYVVSFLRQVSTINEAEKIEEIKLQIQGVKEAEQGD
jgi:hypothetical protein